MKITFILPFPGAASLWKNWAQEQEQKRIDFRNDQVSAGRCTMSFAVSELTEFLRKSDPGLETAVSESVPVEGQYVSLAVEGDDPWGAYRITHDDRGCTVTGQGRNGVLNGAYELLRLAGWRWIEPGIYGECRPEKNDYSFLSAEKNFVPSFRIRGIDQYRESDDSGDFLLWLARHGGNFVFYKPSLAKLADKLGMLSRTGGHLLQKIMAPDALMEDGRTIWEAHPEWYGLPEDGVRKQETAMRVQLCLSNPEVTEYIGDQVLKLFQTEYRDVDILDLWGFDSWGRNCSCPGCRDLGNGSDQNLFLLSRVREKLDRKLGRRVWLNTVSYEGTVTMDPPEKPVPENLIRAGDFVIFYPIKRCYRHSLKDQCCSANKPYRESAEGWGRRANGLSLWLGEYYNVSKYEDLPLLFTELIPREMQFYYDCGFNGSTYMHNLSQQWGVRCLTQNQHLAFSCDVHTDNEALLQDYFLHRYGKLYAAKVREAYGWIREASQDIGAMRNWGASLLGVLMYTEGNGQDGEIKAEGFESAEDASRKISALADLLDRAFERIRECLREEKQRNVIQIPTKKELEEAVTPERLERLRYYDRIEYRLGEDLRGLLWGRGCFRLMALMLGYVSTRNRGESGDELWEKIETCAEELNLQFVPVGYENPLPGHFCKDGLTRTQLRMALSRFRQSRIGK